VTTAPATTESPESEPMPMTCQDNCAMAHPDRPGVCQLVAKNHDKRVCAGCEAARSEEQLERFNVLTI
jgi:hypothetical protein